MCLGRSSLSPRQRKGDRIKADGDWVVLDGPSLGESADRPVREIEARTTVLVPVLL